MLTPQFLLDIHHELVVDLFAGGGGASTGIEQAIGRPVDIAVNHDPEAVSLHQANHPQTQHFVSDVFEVDPLAVTQGRPIGLLWASPDCKHFSKAKGGKPVSKKIRALADVIAEWAEKVRPRVICMENVEEFVTWGQLDEHGYPIAEEKGKLFDAWRARFTRCGYISDFRVLRGCDYGAPTIRKRLFGVFRCDGMPIVWPDPTHGAPSSLPVKAKKLKPWPVAADCIDWSIPCPSIFERERPLAEATLRRIAKGVMRYVVDAAEPFIVRIGHTGHGDAGKVRSKDEPLSTVTSKAEHLLVAPHIAPLTHQGGDRNESVQEPFRTVTGAHRGERAVVSAFLAKHFTGVIGSDLREPMATVTSIDHHSVVTATLEAKHGRTGRAAGADRSRADGGAAGWHHLEAGQARQPAAGFPHRAAAGGAQVEARLLDGEDGVAGADVSTLGARGGVRIAEGTAACGVRREPRGWGEEQQSSRQPGAVDQVGQSQARLQHGAAHSTAELPPAGSGESCTSGEGIAGPGPVLQCDRGAAPNRDHDRIQSGQARVAAFLIRYYGEGGQWGGLAEPMHTIPTKDRLGLVLVAGEPYAIVDIGMRMLSPRELYRAQGFPESYVITRGADGRSLTKTAQVRMCGNSVCPPLARAIVAANYSEQVLLEEAA